VWLAEASGNVVGLLARDGDLIDQLFVAVGEQRRGIGTLLLAQARKLSPTGLRLFTFTRNTAARAFYEKHGFRAVKFGLSPPPESEPDVEYHWRPEAHVAETRSNP
jgi:ribosomal protein S18 acetylase RimI-like enzyme